MIFRYVTLRDLNFSGPAYPLFKNRRPFTLYQRLVCAPLRDDNPRLRALYIVIPPFIDKLHKLSHNVHSANVCWCNKKVIVWFVRLYGR